MTELQTHPALAAGGALDHLGAPVHEVADRLPLVGQDVLWYVASGALDLFAVAEGGQGRWYPLGRLPAGALLPGSPAGATYLLVGRPLAGCALRRIPTAGIGREARTSGELAAAVDEGLRVLVGALRPQPADAQVDEMPPGRLELSAGQQVRPTRVLWAQAARGRVRSAEAALPSAAAAYLAPISEKDVLSCDSDAVVIARTTPELLADGALWRQLSMLWTALSYRLSRRIAERDRLDENRMAAGRQAGQQVLDSAVRSLQGYLTHAVSGDAPAPSMRASGIDVIRLVARAAGGDVRLPHGDPEPRGLDPLQQVLVASGLRSRRVQLDGRWWRADIGPLIGTLADRSAPVALLWRRGRYEMVDPASGRGVAVTEQLAGQLSPEATMLYQPLPANTTNPLRLLLFALRNCRADLSRLAGAGLAAAAIGLLVPVATGMVLGQFVPAGQRSLIIQAAIALAVASLVAMAFSVVEQLSMIRAESRFEATLQASVWDRLLRLPVSFFSRHSTGELASAALGVSRIRQLLSGVATVAVHAVFIGVVNVGLQFWYSPRLALLSAGLAALNVAVIVGVGARQLYWQHRVVALDNALTNRVFQTLRALPKLRVAAAESYAYAQWAGEFIRCQRMRERVQRLQNIVRAFDAAYVPLCTFALLMLVAGPAGGELSVAGLLTFVVSVTAQLTATSQLVGALTAAAGVVPLFAQLEPILAEPPEVAEARRQPGRLTGEIELRNVTFGHSPEEPPVLEDISLRIRPGEFLAVVGPTGCGKSTLLGLLIGFDQPTAGSVRYDGQDLATLDLAAVRRQCGVVLQNARPFAGSILANIRGDEPYSLEEVQRAVDMVGLTDDIAQMPMGLHTVLTDDGNTLSAGQRQRLMIAQALIRKPRILLFDEATSALDNETQRIVTESTRNMKATRVVIAHRLSTIMDADRVVVLSKGRIIQCGTPQELLADTAGLFHQLARRQLQ